MTVLQKSKSLYDVFERKSDANQKTTHYCPGCGHGILHKLLGEALDDLQIQDRSILIAPVGCAVFLYYYFHTSAISAPHGRAAAVGTGISRAHSDAVTISYQGDGDLAAIGTSHTIHAANRGENMIVLFVNNHNYGMTGGQLAPTTLLGQVTATSPYGRSQLNDGRPIKMAEIIATLDAPVFVARCALNSPKNILAARKLLRRGLQAQADRKGYVFIEFLSPCPTNWHKTPVEACRWIEETAEKVFPLGTLKDIIDETPPQIRVLKKPAYQDILDAIGREKPLDGTHSQIHLPYPVVKLKIAGFGGQGVLSAGILLANAIMRKGINVTWLPAYGPEVRGGFANCSMVISQGTIGSPLVEKPNILLALNKPSLFKFAPLVPKDGLIIYNSSLIDAVPENVAARIIAIPGSDLAQQAGSVKATNMVMIGKLLKETGMLDTTDMIPALQETFSKEIVFSLNLHAVQIGKDYKLNLDS
ncbi:MAG: 2-oxoacid:acceptor oxidoreductase family protein [Planctomycetaceae bacterium]|jgi:2-oxoisovalerate ferredoxin oxidoreductase beta subunit|nr:2-oxoacid:acceptor oxidoreductase family protein [Planctomycetaceae bacterium]